MVIGVCGCVYVTAALIVVLLRSIRWILGVFRIRFK